MRRRRFARRGGALPAEDHAEELCSTFYDNASSNYRGKTNDHLFYVRLFVNYAWMKC